MGIGFRLHEEYAHKRLSQTFSEFLNATFHKSFFPKTITLHSQIKVWLVSLSCQRCFTLFGKSCISETILDQIKFSRLIILLLSVFFVMLRLSSGQGEIPDRR